MEINYDEGIFAEADSIYKGIITLGEHKLFLKGPQGDIPQTYIPLEKIEWIKLGGNQLSLFVRPGVSFFYTAVFKGKADKLKRLTKELISRRGFKKKFLRQHWYEEKV